MKSWEKYLPSKANVSPFLQLNCSNFRLKQCGRPYNYHIVQEIRFEGAWGKLE